jgi:hypothetical protein
LERARARRSRRPASAEESTQRIARAASRSTRRRSPRRRPTSHQLRGDRTPCHRRARTPDRSQRTRLTHRQRAPHRRVRQPRPHQPRDRTDPFRYDAHSRGSPHERLPQTAGRLARRASFQTRHRRLVSRVLSAARSSTTDLAHLFSAKPLFGGERPDTAPVKESLPELARAAT